jgi:pectate lyase
LLVAVVILIVSLGKSSNGGHPGPAGSPSASTSAAGGADGLLAERVGFGRGVTGGAAAAQQVVVSSDADSGPGSLRAAVAGNAPKWIVFDRDMTIHLAGGVPVGSNTTIDGRGRHIELSGHGVEGLDLINSSNVIVESLTLHDFGDTAKTAQNDPFDAIHLQHATGVWIDHNDLSTAGDKLISVEDGSTDITVSWNHFHDQEQVFQIGDLAQAQADAAQTVTVHHNYFDRTGYRNPVISYGKAHVYDNYYRDWRLYGVRADRLAQMYLEDNIFDAGRSRKAAYINTGGDGCNDAKTRCDNRPGSIKAVGNLLQNRARIATGADTAAVFDPHSIYPYTAEPATARLATEIASHAGPH